MTQTNFKETDWQEIRNEIHKFEKGNTLIGTLLDKNLRASKLYKGENTAYTLETNEGKQTTFFGSKVLDDRMMSITIGDTVRITYLGKIKPAGGGSEYHDWKVDKYKPKKV